MPEETDRRWHRRWPTSFKARVVFDDQSPALPCIVQNMSASGAQLAFATVFELPREFELEIPSLDLRVEARVVWSRDEQHGVTLVWPQRTPWA
ncbi:PilZ domain-containing protein [Microvirga sp. VF16]|uniref:PilZ domain-containing protein n=1 Tax=Microvirga sp. VF16 TaxID=2807101 RepID=UPI00193D706E|nr:PilZ domain-containing protein [Microvirga sp. VF16]